VVLAPWSIGGLAPKRVCLSRLESHIPTRVAHGGRMRAAGRAKWVVWFDAPETGGKPYLSMYFVQPAFVSALPPRVGTSLRYLSLLHTLSRSPFSRWRSKPHQCDHWSVLAVHANLAILMASSQRQKPSNLVPYSDTYDSALAFLTLHTGFFLRYYWRWWASWRHWLTAGGGWSSPFTNLNYMSSARWKQTRVLSLPGYFYEGEALPECAMYVINSYPWHSTKLGISHATDKLQ
jgi:hypothetical protein